MFPIGWGTDGTKRDGPAHATPIGRFALGRHEVSIDSFKAFLDATKRPDDAIHGINVEKEGRTPVSNVKRSEAIAYCQWKHGTWGRLPSEEEWEFAARDGNPDKRYPWGDRFEAPRAIALGANHGDPVAVGEGEGEGSGLFHLIGNIAEWTSSDAKPYPGSTAAGAPGKVVVRGGAADTMDPEQLTSTGRRFEAPETPHADVGFRCAIDLE